jgi:spermidine/putrescine transport system permease protein
MSDLAATSATSRGLGAPGRARALGGLAPKAIPLALGIPVVAWQTVFFLAPLVFLVVITFWQVRSFRLEPAFVLDNWTRVLNSTAFQRALQYTLGVAVQTTVLAMVISFPVAHLIAFRMSPRLRAATLAWLVVPIFSSYLLRIYAWQIVLSPDGIVNSLIAGLGLAKLPMLGGAFSLQVGLLTLTLPVTILILAMAMMGVDRTLLEAAQNLGGTSAKAILFVLMPAIRPALILAASSAFLLAFGDYVSPVFLTGSKPPTLAILVVDTVKSGSQWPRASAIGVSMLAVLCLVFGIAQAMSQGRRTWGRRRR